MTKNEAIRKLTRAGFQLQRHGLHAVWTNGEQKVYLSQGSKISLQMQHGIMQAIKRSTTGKDFLNDSRTKQHI